MEKLLKLRNLLPRQLHHKQPTFEFYNKSIYLARTSVELPDNTLCFRCKQELTKPEIRQIMTQMYGLDVKEVRTWNKMGKVMKTSTRQYYRKPDFKKVFVELNQSVPAELQYFS